MEFPLIPLPKKCCDLNDDFENIEIAAVSINSTSEEVLWRYRYFRVYGLQECFH